MSPRLDRLSRVSGVSTLLFDLDGTLVDMQKGGLQVALMARALRHFSAAIRPWSFAQGFWGAIKGQQRHGTARTNYEVFLDILGERATCSRAELDAVCEAFIEVEVRASAARSFRPVPGARETLLRAHALGYRLVVATNPVFPLSAVKLRLEWGGVLDVPFERITSSQSMSRCKPDPAYYHELLAQLGVRGAQCLMVGNDPRKDLPAKEAGCYTYILDLPEVRVKHGEVAHDPRLDGYGSYEELRAWLERARGDR